jgi:hypothetical protein
MPNVVSKVRSGRARRERNTNKAAQNILTYFLADGQDIDRITDHVVKKADLHQAGSAVSRLKK